MPEICQIPLHSIPRSGGGCHKDNSPVTALFQYGTGIFRYRLVCAEQGSVQICYNCFHFVLSFPFSFETVDLGTYHTTLWIAMLFLYHLHPLDHTAMRLIFAFLIITYSDQQYLTTVTLKRLYVPPFFHLFQSRAGRFLIFQFHHHG